MSIFTNEYFSNLEKENGIGYQAFDHKDKLIYTNSRDVYLEVKIKNRSEVSIKKNESSKWKTLLTTKKPDPIAIVNYEKNEAYTGDKMRCKASDLNGLDLVLVEVKDGVDVETAYKTRIKDFEEICEKFSLNKEKLLNHEVVIARRLAHTTLSAICGAKHVDDEENVIIEGSIRGALTYCEKGSISNCYDYDVNALYPFLMSKTDLRFPVSKPEKVEIKSKKISIKPEKKLEVYKLKILGNHKYWKNTKDNYYNTYHIETLHLLNIPYEIEGEYKWVYDEPIKSSTFFSYFEELNDLKMKNNNRFAKSVMSATWGALVREKNFQVEISKLNETSFKEIIQIRIDKGYAILRGGNQPYKHRCARLKPFLLAYARLFMLKKIVIPLEQNNHHVHLINTDAVITDANPEEMSKIYPISEKMGDLKIEKVFDGFHDIIHLRCIEECENDFNDDVFDDE